MWAALQKFIDLWPSCSLLCAAAAAMNEWMAVFALHHSHGRLEWHKGWTRRTLALLYVEMRMKLVSFWVLNKSAFVVGLLRRHWLYVWMLFSAVYLSHPSPPHFRRVSSRHCVHCGQHIKAKWRQNSVVYLCLSMAEKGTGKSWKREELCNDKLENHIRKWEFLRSKFIVRFSLSSYFFHLYFSSLSFSFFSLACLIQILFTK